jgi:hypothetical protein
MMKNGYTPTTQDVNGAYVAHNNTDDSVQGEANAEFWRYWGGVTQRGKEAERERIIQLLEGYKDCTIGNLMTSFPSSSDIEKAKTIKDCIYLIKEGEQ